MQAQCIRIKRSAVVYFYFDYTNGDVHGVDGVIRTFITQLLFQLDLELLPYRLERLYSESIGQLFTPESPGRSLRGDLEEIFRRMSQSLDHIYIIGDSLDECRDTPQLDDLLTLLCR